MAGPQPLEELVAFEQVRAHLIPEYSSRVQRVHSVLRVHHLEQTFFQGHHTDAVGDGVDAGLFQIHALIQVLDAENPDGNPDVGRVVGQKADALVGDALTRAIEKLPIELHVAVDRADVQEDGQVAQMVRGGFGEPALEVLPPGVESDVPTLVGGHIGSGALGDPDFLEKVAYGFRKGFGRGSPADDGAVLVGGDDLLPAARAAHMEPEEIPRSVLLAGEMQRLLDDCVVDGGDDAGQLVKAQVSLGHPGDGHLDGAEGRFELGDVPSLEDLAIEREDGGGRGELGEHVLAGHDAADHVAVHDHEVIDFGVHHGAVGIQQRPVRGNGDDGSRHVPEDELTAAPGNEHSPEVLAGQHAQGGPVFRHRQDGADPVFLHGPRGLLHRRGRRAGDRPFDHQLTDLDGEQPLLDDLGFSHQLGEQAELTAQEGPEEVGYPGVAFQHGPKPAPVQRVTDGILQSPGPQRGAGVVEGRRDAEHLAARRVIDDLLVSHQANQPREDDVNGQSLGALFVNGGPLLEIDHFEPRDERPQLGVGHERKRLDLSQELLGGKHMGTRLRCHSKTTVLNSPGASNAERSRGSVRTDLS